MDTAWALERRFREARLCLEIVPQPLGGAPRTARGSGLEDIVQLDIARAAIGNNRRENASSSRGRAGPRAGEWFQVYLGARENRVDVLGIDAPHQQLVLYVEEPRRTFQTRVSRHITLGPDTRIVREEGHTRIVEQVTNAQKRHFLCGMDEQHLFIAQLPYGVSSVYGAREALRAPEVPPSLHLGRRSRGAKIVRQGEWFFLPTLARDLAAVEAALRTGRVHRSTGIAQAARLARSGRPHIADEVIVLRPSDLAPNMDRRDPRAQELPPAIFVRGEVKHPDHKTLVLRDFHRVVPNRERNERPLGVLWVD